MAQPLTWLGEVLDDAGVRVKATEGWKQRAAHGEAPKPRGVLEHHTASHSSEDEPAPTLEQCIKGREGLTGPLCNALIGYDGTVHLIAAGRAHHAGRAGKSGPVPSGDGNVRYIGFEWDYDGKQEPSKKQYRAAVRATAAVLNKLGRSAEAARGHKETSLDGKIDPGQVDLDEFREDVAAAMKKLDRGGKDSHRGDSHDDEHHGAHGRKRRTHLPKPGKGPKPRHKMGPPDPAVYRTIYLVGKDMDVPDKVMLAAFETGLVESHMSNLNWGDADSVGVFQQRPSQGWGGGKKANCMNVNHAAREFFKRAVAAYRDDRDATAGEIAQSVQRSAYPGKYGEERKRALKYLRKAEKHYEVQDEDDSGEHDGGGSHEHGAEKSGGARTEAAADDRGSGRDEDGRARTGRGRDQHGRDDDRGERGGDRGERGGDHRDNNGGGRGDDNGGRRGHDSDGDRDEDSGRGKDGGRGKEGGRGEHSREHEVRTFSSWVAPGGDGSLSAFARSTDGDVVTAWQIGPEDDWVGWLGLGGDSEGLPVAARGRGGALSVFALRESGQVETATRSGAAKWSKWRSIPGEVASRPSALLLRNGALALFAVGSDGKLHTATQTGPNGTWGRWHPVGGDVRLTGQPTVVARANGTTQVFALNHDGEVCTAPPPRSRRTPTGTPPAPASKDCPPWCPMRTVMCRCSPATRTVRCGWPGAPPTATGRTGGASRAAWPAIPSRSSTRTVR